MAIAPNVAEYSSQTRAEINAGGRSKEHPVEGGGGIRQDRKRGAREKVNARQTRGLSAAGGCLPGEISGLVCDNNGDCTLMIAIGPRDRRSGLNQYRHAGETRHLVQMFHWMFKK